MLTVREIQLAQDVVDELRAWGAEDKAAAIERIVAVATPALNARSATEPRELFTISQAARALGVSTQVIKNWANSGQLQSLRLRGRVMIHRDSLLNYLDHLRASTSPSTENPPNTMGGTARRDFVLADLPSEKVERVRVLTEKIEASQPLTPAEETELTRLQDEFARVSWQRLKEWMARPSGITSSGSTS